MGNVLSRHSEEDIIEMFSKYYTSGFIFKVGSDATAGVKLPNKFSVEDIEQCKERFIGLGFEIVPDKYLIDVQRKKYHFFVFYTNLNKLSNQQQKEIKETLSERFDDVTVKKTGEIIATKHSDNHVFSFIESETLQDFLKRNCSSVKLVKNVVGEIKFLCKWETK